MLLTNYSITLEYSAALYNFYPLLATGLTQGNIYLFIN